MKEQESQGMGIQKTSTWALVCALELAYMEGCVIGPYVQLPRGTVNTNMDRPR